MNYLEKIMKNTRIFFLNIEYLEKNESLRKDNEEKNELLRKDNENTRVFSLVLITYNSLAKWYLMRASPILSICVEGEEYCPSCL